MKTIRQVHDLPYLWRTIFVCVVVLGFASSTWGEELSVIRLRRSASVSGGRVLLGDVAELGGPMAQEVGDLVVAEVKGEQTTVTVERVREVLSEHGVHWGKLELGGFSQCEVRPPETPETPETPEAPGEEMTTGGEVTALEVAESAGTLGRRLRQWVLDWVGAKDDRWRVTFAGQEAGVLATEVGEESLEFEPQASGPLGRVPVVVRRYREGALVGTHRVTADVTRRERVVVVKSGTISRGEVFSPGSVELREVELNSNVGEPVTELERVVGQQGGGVLRAGAVVRERDVKSPVLVKRGELMTVRYVAGGLVVRTMGRAEGEGALGQVIEVENERSWGSYTVRVTGLQEGEVVGGEERDLSAEEGAARGGAEQGGGR